MQQLLELYRQWSGHAPLSTEQLPSAGSNRTYYRMSDDNGQSVIGCIGTSRDENHAFVYLARHFTHRRLPVPQILAVSDDELRYLQTDLGSASLFDVIRGGREAGGRYTVKEQELLRRTVRQLPNLQFRGARGLDFSQCYPQPDFDIDSVLFDLNYFKYCFLKATELDFHELKLEADFRLLAKDLTAEHCESFLYRDFQARNVMVVTPPKLGGNSGLNGRMAVDACSDSQPSDLGDLYFIDFQGGRRGPFYYDLASFLWQASARYPDKLRRELINEYYEAAQQFAEMPKRNVFDRRLLLFVFFRTLQVLGAYGFRGYFERKQHFIESIPPAMQNMRELLTNACFPYPYLVELLQRMTDLPQFRQIEVTAQTRADGYKTTDSNPYKAHPKDGPATFSKYDGKGPLVVKVFSFSYLKGIPEDESGNGGGYVFDCRSTHNPGRYEPYKQLTGLDEPVIRFLEDDGEILVFLDSVYKLADAHVRRYIQRGFTSLMFCFGCTGGQHRSVYSAQHLAEHIHDKFGVEVQICHREQNIMQTLVSNN
jgi:aminoglycoside/choline kinase family phosphotransferase